MTYFIYILIGVLQIYNISAFQTPVCHQQNRYTYLQQQSSESSSQTIQLSSSNVDFNSLMIMDVVLFQRNDNSDTINSKLEIGAVQENGNVAPLSTWTLDPSYTSSTGEDVLEFVVDEEDMYPGLSSNEVIIHKRIDVDYGSRQGK